VSGQIHALPLYPQGKTPGSHWIRGWMGPTACLDAVIKRKIPSPFQDSNPPDHPVQCYTSELSWIPSSI